MPFGWKQQFQVLILALSLIGPQEGFARTPALYLWSNALGFITPSQCEIKNEPRTNFAIAQAPGSALNSFSKFKGEGFLGSLLSRALPDRTLIAAKAPAADPNETAFVKVLSIPKNAGTGGRNRVEVQDEGRVAQKVLQDIGNFVIEVSEVPDFLKKLSPLFDAKGTFWQAAFLNENYVTLLCQEGRQVQSYLVFDVYDRAHIHPIAQVGLRPEQVKILSVIRVYTPEEANQLVSPGEPLQPPVPPGSGGGSGSGPGSGGPGGPPPSASPSPQPPGTPSSPETPSGGPLEYILCMDEDSVEVLGPDLKKRLFTGDQFEPLLPIQSWDEKQKAPYLEVQFPRRRAPLNSGWVPRDVVQLKSECQEYKNSRESDNDNNELDTRDVKLNTKDCCKFPTLKRPSLPYTQGKLMFRARRNRGHRLHAGCDLYRRKGEEVRAVASGIIIRGLYYFYQGVFAVEIKHPRFIARYGEILGSVPSEIRKASIVKGGQRIGSVGTVRSGCCPPMLHFELYRGTQSGPLTRYRRPPFDRRADLINPTEHLREWEKAQFGTSY